MRIGKLKAHAVGLFLSDTSIRSIWRRTMSVSPKVLVKKVA